MTWDYKKDRGEGHLQGFLSRRDAKLCEWSGIQVPKLRLDEDSFGVLIDRNASISLAARSDNEVL